MKRDAFTIPLALALPGELTIENFAGGGGTDTGTDQTTAVRHQ